jgi:hypothetical protein
MTLPLLRPTGVAVALAVVGGVGTLVSMVLASGPAWMELTVSELSADPSAGPWFRATMLACGIIGILLALAMGTVLRALGAAGLMSARWARLERVGFWAIALGFTGVAIFPLGVAPLVELAHGTAAYAIPISLLTMMLTARLAVPVLGDAFGRASLLGIAAILLLYAIAVLGLVSYAPMELAGFGIAGAWLLVFVTRLDRLAAAATTG